MTWVCSGMLQPSIPFDFNKPEEVVKDVLMGGGGTEKFR